MDMQAHAQGEAPALILTRSTARAATSSDSDTRWH